MNPIEIFAPRWKDRTILVADWKIGAKNLINITCKKASGERYYPNPIEVSGEKLREYPVEVKPYGKMRVVKLDDILNG